jgi:hypothetical protein
MKVIASLICLAVLAVASGCKRPAGPDNKAVTTNVTSGQSTPAAAAVPVAEEKKDRKPNFTIGKETTYVTGPVDKDGYIDYAAALNERLGKGVTPETNANVLIWQAIGPTPDGSKRRPAKFFKLMGIDEPAEQGEYFVDFKKFVRERLKIEDAESAKKLDEQLSETARHEWSVNDYPQIAEWLKANEKPLALVIEASKRSGYFSPATGSSILGSSDPAQHRCRELARALASRALVKVSEGKSDAAWQDLLACHRLARLVGRGWPYFAILNGYSVDTIAATADVAFLGRADLNANEIQACIRDLRSLPPMHSMAECVDVAERFEFLNEMMLFAKHGLWYVEQLTPSGLVSKNLVDAPVENINWDPGLRTTRQWFDRFVDAMREKDRPTRQHRIELAEKDFQERKDTLRSGEGNELYARALRDEISPEGKGQFYGELLIIMLFPPVSKVQIAADRAEQQERNLHVAFALAAYKSDNKSYPKSLDALVPKYLAKLPDDLFTGNSLIYRPSKNGYLLYSFGPDGKDDEGRGPKDEPKGDDIAIRMPVPKPGKK